MIAHPDQTIHPTTPAPAESPLRELSKTLKSRRRFWISVIELDDVVARRHPQRPNLFVGRTLTPPENRLEVERRRKHPRWYSHAIVRARPDLAPDRRYSSLESATRACEKVVALLTREGYTVNRDTRVWTVYVVELDKAAISSPGKGFVYVGETSLNPEKRFKQHKEGARNKRGPLYSRVVHKHGIRLRPDLAPRRKFYDQASAKKAERQHFELLKSKGYAVRGGH